MKRPNMPLLVLACLVVVTTPLGAEKVIALRVTPQITAAAPTLSITVQVEPNERTGCS